MGYALSADLDRTFDDVLASVVRTRLAAALTALGA